MTFEEHVAEELAVLMMRATGDYQLGGAESQSVARSIAPRVAAAIEAGKDATYIHTLGEGCEGCTLGGHWHEQALAALRGSL